MKKIPVSFIVVVVSFGLISQTSFSQDKEPRRTKPQSNSSFEMTGTVTKAGVNICMRVDLEYDLHPNGSDIVHLSDGHRYDLRVLENATKDGKAVQVKGKWITGAECKYVQVASATPVK